MTKQDKNLNILRIKRAFKIKKSFFIIFNELSLKQKKKKKKFKDGESPALK